jgi:PTS system fructose-specific IIC component
MAFHCTSRAPHGGIWVVGLIGKPLLYVVAIVAGTVVSSAVVVALKTRRGEVAEEQPVVAAAAAPQGSGNSTAVGARVPAAV